MNYGLQYLAGLVIVLPLPHRMSLIDVVKSAARRTVFYSCLVSTDQGPILHKSHYVSVVKETTK